MDRAIAVLRLLLALLMGLGTFGVARAASAACTAAGPAAVTFADGRPLVYETGLYGTPDCPQHEVVDVTYKASASLPGTYLSWADSDPTSASCQASRLVGKVWDMTSSPPVYKGEASSTGVWVPNRDPNGNRGTSVCHVAPIRFESRFSFTAGRKYRFALRAYRSDQKGVRDLAFANAPLATPNSGCDSETGVFYCALTVSGGANDNWDRWPTSSHRIRLEPPNLKVAQGGDLFFQNGTFFQPHRTYTNPRMPNFGYSNAALLYKGSFSSVDAFNCGDFTMLSDIYAHPYYTYIDEENTSTTATGASYCMLNARNNSIYKLRVEKSSSNVIVVGFRFDKNTERAAWGCLDGMCDADVRIASQFMKYTTTDRDSFVRRQFELLHESRYCIEESFQRVLPVPLSMALHGERMQTNTVDSWSFGLGGLVVTSVGFQGLHRAGTNRIRDARDIRFELHESTHAYNANLFAGQLPSWLNEGLAIQTTRLTCGGNPDYMRDSWRGWTPGRTDGHSVGSEFFKRLESEYACNVDCAYGLWRALVDNLAADTSITNYEIKQVLEASLGRSLTPLFTLLAIPYPVAGP